MRLLTVLLWCVVALGQKATTPPDSNAGTPNQPPTNPYGLAIGAKGQPMGAVDILSDPQGVDFGPYLKPMLKRVRKNWLHLIPDSAQTRKGKLAIEFAINRDGKIVDMRLVASSDDTALDRAAWGGITASNPFAPLPSKFTGPYLALRFRFYYNP